MRRQNWVSSTIRNKQGYQLSTFQCSESNLSYMKTENIRETDTTIKTKRKFISRCSSPQQKDIQNHQKISLSSLIPKKKQLKNNEVDSKINRNKICFCFQGGQQASGIDFGFTDRRRDVSFDKKVYKIDTPVNELLELQSQGGR